MIQNFFASSMIQNFNAKQAFGYISPRRTVSQLINSPTAKFELYKPNDCFYVTDPNCFVYDFKFTEIKYSYDLYQVSMWGSKKLNVRSDLYNTNKIIFNRSIILNSEFVNWQDEWLNNYAVMNELAHLQGCKVLKNVLLPEKLLEFYQNQDLLL